MANKITYNIGFNVDGSGLKQIQAELQKISNMSEVDIKLLNPKFHGDVNEIKKAASEVQQALTKSFNTKLDGIDLTQFNKEMSSSSGWAQNLYNQLSKLGPAGVQNFNKITSTLLTTKNTARETSKWLDDLSKTFTNTLRWSIASSALNAISSSIQQAWGYTKKLDASLNDIRIVTGKSADEMERFAKEANKAAKGLGASTTAYTNASLIYYQQGLGEDDVQARTNVTLKAANVTGQSAAEVSQQLTAVWNGYKVVAEEAEMYVDKLAAVAATTAADLEELSDGMSKVASAANTMGVDIDQLSAQLSTIVSVTRQDASLVGTALKTIYARMGDLKVSGVDEFGTSLGDVSGQMRQMGIEVLDQEGNLRDMGEVIEEVAAKWGTWTDAQQQAAAVAIAGKRQYNNLIALFENWDMYESALNTSQTSEGTLQKQQDIYMDSLEAHITKVSTATEKLFDALINNAGVNKLLDVFASIISFIGDMVDGVGGLTPILLSLGGVLSKVFSTQIVNSVKSIGSNIKQALLVTGQAYGKETLHTQAEKVISSEYKGTDSTQFKEEAVAIKEKELSLGRFLTEEQRLQYDAKIKELEVLHNKKIEQEAIIKLLEDEKKAIDDNIKAEQRAVAQKKERERKDKKASIDEKKATLDALIDNKSIGEEGHTNKSQQSRIEAARRKSLQMTDVAKKLQKDKKDIQQEDFDTGTGKTSGWGQIGASAQDRKNLKTANVSETKKFLKQKEKSGEIPVDTKASEQFIKIKEAEKQALETIGTKGSAAYKKIEVAQEAFYRGAISGERYLEALIAALKDGAKECDTTANELDEATQALDSIGDETEEATKAAEEYAQSLKKVDQELEKVKGQADQTQTAIDQVNTETDELHAQNQKGAEYNKVMDVLSASMQVMSALGSIVNMWKTINDEAASSQEKITSVIMTILTVIMTVVPAIVSICTAAGIQISISLWLITAIVAAITAVVAIIAVIVKSVSSMESDLDKANRRLEEASAATEKARKKVEELKDAYAELKSEINQFKDAKLAIDEMRKGTEEWQQAVQDLNFQVLELITKYPQLAEFMTVDQDGVYGIQQEGFDLLLQEQQQRIADQQSLVSALALSTSFRKDEKLRLEQQSEVSDIFKDFFDKQGLYLNNKNQVGIVSSTQDYRRDQNGNFMYDEQGALMYETKNYTANQELIDILKKMGASSKTQSNDYGDTWEIVSLDDNFLTNLASDKDQILALDKLISNTEDSELKQRLQELREAVLTNNQQLMANQLAIEAQTKAYLGEVAKEKGLDENTYADITADELTTEDLDISDKVSERKFYDKSREGGHSVEGQVWIGNTIHSRNEAKDVQNMLQKLADEAFGSGTKVDAPISLLKGTHWEDLGGLAITVNGNSMTVDELVEAAAQKEMNDEISKKTEQDETNMQNLKNAGLSQSAAYFLNNNDISKFDDNATTSEIQNIINNKSAIESATGQKFTTDPTTYLKNWINKQNQVISKFGFDAANTMFAQFTEADFTTFANNMSTATMLGADDAVKALFDKIGNNPELTQKVNNLMTNVNWDDATSVQEFRAALANLGIDIATIGGNWDTFINNALSGTKQWISSSKKVLENLQTINSVLKDLKVGDIISDEDYKKIMAIAPELSKNFIRGADGWISLDSGNTLSKIAKNQYSNLNEVTTNYSNIKSNALKYGSGNVQLKVDDLTSDQLLNYWNSSSNNIYGLAGALGISTDKINEAKSIMSTEPTDSTEYIAAQDQLKLWLQQINQAAIDAANGLFDSEVAQEIFITEIADSWDDIVSASQDLSEESKKKAKSIWNSKYLEELGFGGEMVDFLNDQLDPVVLEGRVEKVRKLELNYLQEIEAKVQKLDVALERAFGTRKLALMEDQLELQKENLSITNTKKDIAQDEYIASGQNLLTYYAGAQSYINPFTGITDLNGLLNYISTLPEADKQNFDAYLDKYQQSLDLEQQYIEASWQVVDGQIALFESEQNMVREFREFEKEWAQNINKLKNTNFDGLATFAEDFSHEFKTSFQNLSFSNAQWTSTWSNEVAYLTRLQAAANTNAATLENGEKNPFWNETKRELDAAKAQAAINEQLGLMYDQYEGLYDEANELYDSIMSAGEEINALYDEQIDKLSSANDLLASSIELYKLVGKGMRGSADDIKAYSTLISVNAMESINYAQAELLTQKRLYAEAVEKGEQDAREQYAQSQADAAAKYAETLQNAFNTVAEQFGIQLEAVIDEAIGEGGLQAFSDAWELEKTYDNAYLDDVNAEYAMYEFDRNVQKSIDETDNIVAQNKLIEMRQRQEARLNAIIAERGRLSQHEIDLANAEYELTLKKIALEEAQQTANTMKLTRDAFGNYSYQYVADENKIADAEAEVKAAENELYNLRKEHEKELIDNFGAYLTDYQTQRAEAVAAKNDALVAALDEKYLGKNGLLTNLQSEVLSLGDGTGLFVGQLDTIADMNFDNLKANIDNLTSSTQTQLEKITNTINSSIGSGDFIGAATILADTATNLDTLTANAEKIIGTFSSSVDKLSEVVGKLDSAASTLTQKANTAINNYGSAVEQAAVENNYNIENIDINLADGNFIDTTSGSDDEETEEGASTGNINISNFIGAINSKIAEYFNNMSESLQNNDITKALGDMVEAVEENTEAIQNLTETMQNATFQGKDTDSDGVIDSYSFLNTLPYED